MKFSDQYPIEPLAAALLRVIERQPELAPDSPRMLFGMLALCDKTYQRVVDRPYTLKSFCIELESRAAELHRDYGIVLTIFDDGELQIAKVAKQ